MSHVKVQMIGKGTVKSPDGTEKEIILKSEEKTLTMEEYKKWQSRYPQPPKTQQ